jgi:hypothetical protein
VRITATSFTNEYQWGNFRGDPRQMMSEVVATPESVILDLVSEDDSGEWE